MRNQKFFPPVKSSSYKHKADPIFALPKLQVVMESKQTLHAYSSDDGKRWDHSSSAVGTFLPFSEGWGELQRSVDGVKGTELWIP